MTLWDELPDAARTEEITQGFRAHVADITTGPPSIDDYEVLAEL